MNSRTRPRSPDVQIYRPQLTSVLSIAHRASGLWLTLGSVLLVAWLAAVAAGGAAQAALQAVFASWIGRLLLVAWSLALFYHLCNGIRHLAWDLGYGFELAAVYKSGWLVVLVSASLTALSWIIAFTVMR